MEYQLAPSPIRANHLGSQLLNPVQGLTYFKRVFNSRDRVFHRDSISAKSFFDLYATEGVNYDVYGGVKVLSSGADSRLLFPPGFFVRGNLIRLLAIGQLGNFPGNGVYFTFTAYNLQKETGVALVNPVTQTTDTRAAEDDLGTDSAFSIELIYVIRSDSTDSTLMSSFGHGILSYKNLNAIEGSSQHLFSVNVEDSFNSAQVTGLNLTVTPSAAHLNITCNLESFIVEVG